MTAVDTTAGEIYWDPYDIELDTNPHPTWKRMRDEAPLYRNDRYDFWALSRFEDVEAASKDPLTYSSAEGTVLEMMGDHMRSAGQMIFMDPPEHTKLRTLVSRAFTPRRISALEPRIREICAELLDPHVGSGGFDFLQDFGAILPSRVISDLVGVPREVQEEKRHIIDQLFHIEPGVGMVNDISVNATFALIGFLEELLADREANPRDDMLTALVQAEITEDDGSIRRLTIPEAASFGMLLYTAGTETVARLLGNAAVELAANPDQRADLVADPDLAGNAVEELLRYEAPSPVQGRTVTREVEWYGETLPAGSRILLLTGSAGRDERVFPDADRFDIRRQMQHHLSFGYGIHFCVGAALARMEGRVALQEVTRRFPEWEVDFGNARRLHTSTVRGWAEVPVTV
jgi:cytochrome P450